MANFIFALLRQTLRISNHSFELLICISNKTLKLYQSNCQGVQVKKIEFWVEKRSTFNSKKYT